MKKLLISMAIIEALTGISLMAVPSLVASKLLGAESLDAVSLTIARIAGAALISLAIACWLFRQSDHGVHIVKTMLFYNVAVAVVLIHAKLALVVKGNGLVPAMVVHLAIAVWSIIAIQAKPSRSTA
jgi:hypothetical protein